MAHYNLIKLFTIKNFIFIILAVFCVSNSGTIKAGDYQDLLMMKYKLGDYDFVLKSDHRNSNLYKGFLYEYGLIGSDTHKAVDFYNRLSQPHRDYRKFMFCFLYCIQDLNRLYTNNVDKNPAGRIVFAVASELYGLDCEAKASDDNACNLGRILYKKHKNSDDIYFSVGKSFFNRDSEESINELSYYFLKKSLNNGGVEAANYLSDMHYWIMWVPRDCNEIRRLSKVTLENIDKYNECRN
jgi:hypothetical protein